ncbi:MAG TPA: AMP-binding protein, partial [Methanomassiliicoccales archaeon]|nr:AMP-binding protein [Methanomassiliicoccales archaeon]
KVRKELRKDPEFRRALGRSRLTDVSRADLVEYHLHMFRKVMRYTDANSIYYRQRFRSLDLRPEMIKEYDDLLRVPVTEPGDLAAEPYHFLCVSQKNVMRAFSTSGTSGQRKRLFYTQEDVLNIVDSIASALRNTGMTKEDTLQIMFPAISAWDPSLMLDGACKVAGLRSKVCSVVDVEEQIKAIRESKAKVMIGLTSFIYRVTMLAQQKHDLRQFGLKAIICSSEPLSEAMRREIEAAWGCKALTQYGMTEMGLATSIECFAQDGLHIDEGNYMAECIDPVSGQRAKDRQPGELVWTSFNMKGSPLLRYRSYDLSCYISPPCGCGYTTVGKMGKPRGRINAETKLAYGEKIFPSLFDEAVLSVHGVLGYQAVLDRVGFRDRLTFNVEYMGDTEEGAGLVREKVMALDEIKSSMDNDLLEPILVEIVPASKEFVPKQKVIVDNRKLFDK